MQLRKVVKQEWLLLTMLILVSLSSQLIFLRPISLSDEMAYYRTAVNFPRLPQYPNHWSMRLGVVLPVAILYRLVGHSELVYYLLPITSTILLVISTYLIGRMLFSRVIGAAAAMWISFLPYFLLESGNLLPDITASACLTTGIMLLLTLIDKPIDKKQRWVLLLAGALFGWAYLAKEYFAVFALIIPIIFWLFKIPRKHLLLVAFGISMMVAIEFFVHAIGYGNPLQRFMTTQPRETAGYIERDILDIMGIFFFRMSNYKGAISNLIAVSGLAFLTIMSINRSKAHLFLLTWILLVYLFFTILGLLPVLLGWDDEVLLRLQVFRYWIPILPPLAIGSAAALYFSIDYVEKKIFLNAQSPHSIPALMLALIICAACIFNAFAVGGSEKFLRTEGDHYQDLRTYLQRSDHPGATIWIVRDLKVGYEYVLPIYAHTPFGREIWGGTIKYLNTDGVFLKADEITYGSVLIDRENFNPTSNSIPGYLNEIPHNWQLVFESRNERVAIYDVH